MARDEINAFLGAGTNYHGKLHFQGAVRIDGNFQGEVVSEGTLVIGQEAIVEGQIKVGQLVLSGKIKGEVEAKNKVVLHKTANLQGNIRTPVLVVEEGAVLEGELIMGSLGTASDTKPEKDSDQS
ncbi:MULTISPECIES: polymer-forming cytoskeletal protein [unclassified Pseudodesulfovibrio]|uniref:bactofilin family protein n=1 Tax=unclassified Pseudodesulfovibrio TaxID=2661612 RepID=UPI000FEBDFE0|nr:MULTISPECIES: polymer-forming cytoskeletal protein [unclassified Pseudodesulfovibrio]MCJ2165431.1 polymer-forming cytoskeletal protein [Pseudodesulfovibrio sp. S3-i]RWU03181.1 polymer-forming cytoskeletal protein [Pseudodesulfovibrio sp. S3]